jgi:hypothetical protein
MTAALPVSRPTTLRVNPHVIAILPLAIPTWTRGGVRILLHAHVRLAEHLQRYSPELCLRSRECGILQHAITCFTKDGFNFEFRAL